jgi:formate hydrogenlyase subunit 3/multisubunit Na+/H+ antiporter MnhD subunit
VLGAVALFAVSILVDSITITALTLQLGAILLSMLIPITQPGAAMAGMRTMVLFVLAGSLLVLASWATGGQGGPVDSVTLTYIIGISVTAGISILMAVFPFHIWLAPAQRGSPLVAVTLSVALSLAALAQLDAILETNLWPGGRSFFGLLMLLGGLANAVWGGIGAFVQRSLRRVLTYAAMADLGLILIGIGLDTGASLAAAYLQLLYRGLGVTLAAVSVHVLLRRVGTDDLADLRGAWKQAPLAVLGLAAGGMSLVGLPPMAGFANRFVLYQLLAAQHPAWVLPVVLAAAGPAWAFMRAVATALMPPEEGATSPRAAQRLEWLLIVPLALALALPSIFPRLLTLLPAPWVELITGTALGLLGG